MVQHVRPRHYAFPNHGSAPLAKGRLEPLASLCPTAPLVNMASVGAGVSSRQAGGVDGVDDKRARGGEGGALRRLTPPVDPVSSPSSLLE